MAAHGKLTAAKNDGGTTTDEIGNVTSDDGAKESSA